MIFQHALSASYSQVKSWLKWLRRSQPFNYVLTSMAKSMSCSFEQSPEWLIRHLHRHGQVRSTLPNGRTLRMWSRGDDWVSNQLFWRGWNGYETETSGLFFRLATRAKVLLMWEHTLVISVFLLLWRTTPATYIPLNQCRRFFVGSNEM